MVICTFGKIKELNSFYDDIAPSISADGSEIIFNTNKHGNYDIYSAERKNRKWQSLKALNSLNSEGDDVSSSLAYDGQRLLLFKFTNGQSDIYESKLQGTEWSEPKLKMSKVVNTDANETFASYDPQDIKVYFITDGSFAGDKNINFSGKKDMEESSAVRESIEDTATDLMNYANMLMVLRAKK